MKSSKYSTHVAKELELWPEITRESAGLVELSRPPPTRGSDKDIDVASGWRSVRVQKGDE
jgi:hypothetical protein